MKRREILKLSAGLFFSSAAATVSGKSAKKTDKLKVIVVGAGQGGVSAIQYLVQHNYNIDISLYDASTISAFKRTGFLGYVTARDYINLIKTKQVRVKNEKIIAIDPIKKTVVSQTGNIESYDVLVLAPGISYVTDKVIGISTRELKGQVAWKNPQNEIQLIKSLKNIDNGGIVIISAPPAPYRYPVGPYQRATKIANFFKAHKPQSKVILLDEKDTFSGQSEYLEYWKNTLPKGMIEWIPASLGGSVKSYSEKHKIIITNAGKFKADIVNYIPSQRAGSLAIESGLTTQGGWCPVNPLTMESALVDDIYVIGDANDSTQHDKTGFNARLHSNIAATSILDKLG